MRRPSLGTYLLGNFISMIAILAFSGMVIYRWWVGIIVNDWMLLVPLICVSTTTNASRQLREYSNWKRAWDGMGDRRPIPWFGILRRIIGPVVWVGAGLYLLSLDRHPPQTKLLIGCYVALLVLMLGRSLLRWHRMRAANRPRKTVVVAITLPLPRRSPSVRQCMRTLPDHCAQLVDAAGKRA